MTQYDAIIVGGGPAGSAAALQLAQRDPERARRSLLIDAAVFPREKLCGGGVVPEADQLLACVGIKADVPAVAIREVRFLYPGGETSRSGPGLLRVVRRVEFDHCLLQEVRARGVQVREGERVDRVERVGHAVCVTTTAGCTYEGLLVIGADGARSRVRRQLVGSAPSERFVALEVLTPAHDGSVDGDSDTATFDFRPVAEGLRGYRWHFPCVQGGRRLMNRGIVGSTRTPVRSLDGLLRDGLVEKGLVLDRRELQGAGVPHYDPGRPQSAERVLLAGDAVGIDPWFGEGISVAIGTGILAAHTAIEACETGRFEFSDYRERILRSAVGMQLLQRLRGANRFYPAAAGRASGEMEGEA